MINEICILQIIAMCIELVDVVGLQLVEAVGNHCLNQILEVVLVLQTSLEEGEDKLSWIELWRVRGEGVQLNS